MLKRVFWFMIELPVPLAAMRRTLSVPVARPAQLMDRRGSRHTNARGAGPFRAAGRRSATVCPPFAKTGCSGLLLAQHDQGIGAVGHLPPLRIVVGLELPGFAALRHQEHLAVI